MSGLGTTPTRWRIGFRRNSQRLRAPRTPILVLHMEPMKSCASCLPRNQALTLIGTANSLVPPFVLIFIDDFCTWGPISRAIRRNRHWVAYKDGRFRRPDRAARGSSTRSLRKSCTWISPFHVQNQDRRFRFVHPLAVAPKPGLPPY